jgi:hypothetical protein
LDHDTRQLAVTARSPSSQDQGFSLRICLLTTSRVGEGVQPRPSPLKLRATPIKRRAQLPRGQGNRTAVPLGNAKKIHETLRNSDVRNNMNNIHLLLMTIEHKAYRGAPNRRDQHSAGGGRGRRPQGPQWCRSSDAGMEAADGDDQFHSRLQDTLEHSVSHFTFTIRGAVSRNR